MEQFDAEKVGAKVCLRHWRPGDRFRPIGATSAVKLQDIFTNLKVPRAERHRRVVAATGQRPAFLGRGLRMAEDFKLEQNDRPPLELGAGSAPAPGTSRSCGIDRPMIHLLK